MSNKFICKECSSEELAFTSYVKCLIPVVIGENGNVQYLEPIVNSDDYIQNTSYFCCSGCGSPVGNHLQTEQDLLEYLSSQALSHN